MTKTIEPRALRARFERIARSFGVRWVSHRIGSETLRVAEVAAVDRCVEALYPDCLVSHGDAPVWMISWPAAFGLAEWLLLHAPLAGASVLELGCGTAVAGVAAARAGARVLATDYDLNALAFAAQNARENDCDQMQLGRLDWYVPDLTGRYGWVVGSEITYHEVAFPALRALLDRVLAPSGRVLLSDIYRPQSTVFRAQCEAAGFSAREHRIVVHLAQESRPVRVLELWRG